MERARAYMRCHAGTDKELPNFQSQITCVFNF